MDIRLAALCRLAARKFLTQNVCRLARMATALTMMLALPANVSMAQQVDSAQPDAAPQAASQSSTLTVPAGTKLPLGLLRPFTAKAGKDVYLQITFPVAVGSQMLIPPGTYLKGVVTKLIHRDRTRDTLEFEIGSANLIFANGYTVPITGTIRVATPNISFVPGQASPAVGQATPSMAAVGGAVAPPPLPPLPSLGSGPRNAIIAVGVIGAVAATVGIVLAARRDYPVEVGTPLEMTLPAPLVLDALRVTAAVQQYAQQVGNAPPQIVQPPVRPKMCYDPGTPATPDTVIPGTPGTPPSGNFPGTPGTPDTVIPGSPGTPASTYPCPG